MKFVMDNIVWFMFMIAGIICFYVGISEMTRDDFNVDSYMEYDDREAVAKFFKVRGPMWIIIGAGGLCMGLSMTFILNQILFDIGGACLFVGMAGIMMFRRIYFGKSDTKWFS